MMMILMVVSVSVNDEWPGFGMKKMIVDDMIIRRACVDISFIKVERKG